MWSVRLRTLRYRDQCQRTAAIAPTPVISDTGPAQSRLSKSGHRLRSDINEDLAVNRTTTVILGSSYDDPPVGDTAGVTVLRMNA